MKFLSEPQYAHSGFCLVAEPDDYSDGRPAIDRLVLDTIVQNLSRDRLAVAGSLVFGEYVGNEIELDKPVSRLVQQSIRDYFVARDVSVSPVTDVAQKAWPSAGTMHISAYDRFFVPPVTPPGVPHDYYVQLADGRNFNGALATAHQIAVAANLDLLSSLRGARMDRNLLSVAIGVLMSEDLHMRNIHICDASGGVNLARAQTLVRSLGLNLSWGNSAA